MVFAILPLYMIHINNHKVETFKLVFKIFHSSDIP